MSNFYIIDEDSDSKTSLINPTLEISKNLDMKKYEIKNLKTFPTTNASATSKKYVNDEDKKLLPLNGSRAMTDDIDMGGNTLLAVGLISASNSAVPRSYINTNFVSRTSETTMSAHINMANYSIKNIPTPSHAQHPATKNYVDQEVAKVNIICYNYVCTYPELTPNSWKYPQGASYTTPHIWMYLPRLSDNSYFELQYHIFDTDNNFPSGNMNMEYRLQVFQGSSLKSRSFFDGNIKNYRIQGENFVVIGQKYYFKDFPSSNYKQFSLARLSVKRKFTSTFGNESRVGIAIIA